MISYRGDGVGAGAVGDLRGGRAVGGVGRHDLGGVADGAVVAGGGDGGGGTGCGGTGHEGSRGGDDGGTHFERILSYLGLLV